MKRKITMLIAAGILSFQGIRSQTSCSDLNGFVNYKNVGGTSSYQLQTGYEEYAGQTYNYSGPGKITSVRVYGSYPGFIGGVPLQVGIYDVDGSGRPTTAIQTVNTIWWTFDNATGYINVTMPGGGVSISHRFAVTVRVLNSFPFGNSFNLRYTGNGEGLAQDLASLAGTSTGNNWSSAKNNFSKDGDFYLVPNMTHYITPSFNMPACNVPGANVSFTNATAMTTDSMFNKIGLYAYSGSNKYYTWNFGDGSSVSNLTNPTHAYANPGVYTVSLTAKMDGWNGLCSATYTSKVSVGLAVSATSIGSVTCYGAATGTFVAAGIGGAPNYSYSTNGTNYQASATFTNVTAGTRTVYIKDALNCVSTSTFAVAQPPAITFSTVLTSNASCGNADGSLMTSASGGVGTLQYKIDNGSFQSAATFSALSAGVHTIVAKDANTCTVQTTALVNDFGGPTITSLPTSQVSCFGGSNGMISINASGGTGALVYSINGGLSTQSTNTFSNLTAGVYAVLVKDASNCTDVTSVTINQPPQLVVNASSSPALCFGSSNGSINIQSSIGGIGQHNYSINGSTYQSGTSFGSLPAGNYTVYVKDVANCVGTTTLAVTQPAAITSILSATAASCNGMSNGSISVVSTGGTGSMMYSLNGVNFQPGNTFGDLISGNYTVTVKDANNCTSTATILVTQPSAITTTVGTTNSTCGNANGGALIIAGGGAGGFQYSINGTTYNATGVFSLLSSGTYYVLIKDASNCTKVVPATVVDSNGPSILGQSHVNVSCYNNNNGMISITNVSGGSGQLQYSINGINWQTSPTFNNLPAGSYNVAVKDANSCIGTTLITITQPNPFIINPIVVNASCNGSSTGAATITAAGGSGVLAYSINSGFSYQSSNVFQNLSAGTYVVVVKDAANCVGGQTFDITQPPAIVVNTGVLNVTCYGLNNGVVTISASGGVGSLLYSLNGSPYSTTQTYTGLAGGVSYIANVKDGNNCVQSQLVFVPQPAQLNVAPTVNNVSCAGGNNGAISLAVSGGVFPYSYNWSNGSSGQGIFNLAAGSYYVNVTDFNGCSSALNFTITQPSNPLIINANVNNTSGSANNGSIDITVTGGTPPYSYSWSNNSTSEDISGLAAGAYLVTVTDASGCVSSSTFIVNDLLGISANVLDSDVKVYPNPASQQITVEAKGMNIDKVEVYSVLGQKVIDRDVHSTSTVLNTTELARGSYFVKLHVAGQVVTKRIALVN